MAPSRSRAHRRDVRRRVLVVHAGRFKQTKAIAAALAERLSHDGLIAELADLDAGVMPPAADYVAVVIGSGVRFGRNPPSVLDYILRSREALAAMPTFFFSVDDGDLAGILRVTGWAPTGSVMFDPIRPDRRRFLKQLGGHPASSTELALAESNRVRSFAATIGHAVQREQPGDGGRRDGSRPQEPTKHLTAR